MSDFEKVEYTRAFYIELRWDATIKNVKISTLLSILWTGSVNAVLKDYQIELEKIMKRRVATCEIVVQRAIYDSAVALLILFLEFCFVYCEKGQ